jgi:signal transduction histidine kinase
VPERERPRIRECFTQTVADGKSRGILNPILTRHRGERLIEWSNTTLKDGRGETIGVLAVGHDITALKVAQQRALQAERLAAIGEMMTGLAHESRNALQRGQACLEMLRRRLTDRPEALDLLAGIQESQDDLHRLYEEVRSYAAPIVLERRWCPLRDVLHEAWDRLGPVRQGRAACLAERGLADPACEADRFRLVQVFVNILENALAACPNPVQIDVVWAEDDLDGQPALRGTVRDNGPGLSADQRQHLFEPFYTTKAHGTGLGLAIARRLVEAHGGRIEAGPEEAPGASLLITLPRGHP